MQNIENKVVIITGASSGMGAETARHLVKAGARVILGARRLERLHALADELGISHEHCVATDVSDPAQVQALADRALTLYGRIDVLLNGAGIMPLSMMEELKLDEWNSMIDINLRGVLHGIAAVLPTMKAQKSGQIINISSVAAHVWGPMFNVYSATKVAVSAVTESLRKEVKPYNIRTTLLCPGATQSELRNTVTSPIARAALEAFGDEISIPPSAIAQCVLFAISQPEAVDINEIIVRPTNQEL